MYLLLVASYTRTTGSAPSSLRLKILMIKVLLLLLCNKWYKYNIDFIKSIYMSAPLTFLAITSGYISGSEKYQLPRELIIKILTYADAELKPLSEYHARLIIAHRLNIDISDLPWLNVELTQNHCKYRTIVRKFTTPEKLHVLFDLPTTHILNGDDLRIIIQYNAIKNFVRYMSIPPRKKSSSRTGNKMRYKIRKDDLMLM